MHDSKLQQPHHSKFEINQKWPTFLKSPILSACNLLQGEARHLSQKAMWEKRGVSLGHLHNNLQKLLARCPFCHQHSHTQTDVTCL